MIPKSTTLQERFEFYTHCLNELEEHEYYWICLIGNEFYKTKEQLISEELFSTKHLPVLFPELFSQRKKEGAFLWCNSHERIQALEKAIIEVKRKIEEE